MHIIESTSISAATLPLADRTWFHLIPVTMHHWTESQIVQRLHKLGAPKVSHPNSFQMFFFLPYPTKDSSLVYFDPSSLFRPRSLANWGSGLCSLAAALELVGGLERAGVCRVLFFIQVPWNLKRLVRILINLFSCWPHILGDVETLKYPRSCCLLKALRVLLQLPKLCKLHIQHMLQLP